MTRYVWVVFEEYSYSRCLECGAAGEHIAGVFDSYEDAIAAALKIKGQTRATKARFGEALALGDL